MCGETRIPRDMCAGNTLPGETYITVTPELAYKVEKFAFAGLFSKPICQTCAQRALMAPVPLNKQVPGYGSPNDCPLLLSID